MDVEDDPDISLSIPLKSLYEELCCPICFNPIKDCYITPCGHNFCGDCIKECLDRKHNCPCCNHECLAKQLLKNHHHDRLVTIVNAEKEEASKKYFEKLFNGQNTGNDNKPNTNNTNEAPKKVEKLSPVEEVFHKHIKKSLMAYEDYYQELEKKHEKNIEMVKTFFVKKMADVSNNSKSKNEVDQQVALLTAECEFKVKELQETFKESVTLLTVAYEKYMETSLPTPSFLPVSISIALPSKKLVWKKYIVKPTDTLNEIKDYVAKKLEESGNPIVDYHKDAKWVIRRGVSALNIDDSLNQNVTIVTNPNLPLLQYELHQNEEICLLGDVQLKSDMPKKCFSSTFEKGKEVTMDYYTCKDCKLNWVCKPCAESCHKGHTISEYIMNHKATWACCYCAKNKKCSLVK